MSGFRRVAVVIPMRDESAAVAPLLSRFISAAENGRGFSRILVIDGDSSDGTPDRVRAFADRLPLEIVELGRNLGLGGALDAGLRRAIEGADAVVTMDGDGSHDPHAITSLLTRLDEGYDVIIASRFVAGGREIGVAAHRRALSHAASALLRALFPFGAVRDYSSGFRVYRVESLRKVAREGSFIREVGFACMLELLLRIRQAGGHAGEVPLVLRYDLKPSASKMDVPRTVLRTLVVIARNWRTAGSWGARPPETDA